MLDKGTYMSEEVKESLISTILITRSLPQPIVVLSDREMEIADRLIHGEPMKIISTDLNIHSNCDTYKNRIFEKLNIQSIPELIKIFDTRDIKRLRKQ